MDENQVKSLYETIGRLYQDLTSLNSAYKSAISKIKALSKENEELKTVQKVAEQQVPSNLDNLLESGNENPDKP